MLGLELFSCLIFRCFSSWLPIILFFIIFMLLWWLVIFLFVLNLFLTLGFSQYACPSPPQKWSKNFCKCLKSKKKYINDFHFTKKKSALRNINILCLEIICFSCKCSEKYIKTIHFCRGNYLPLHLSPEFFGLFPRGLVALLWYWLASKLLCPYT